MKIQISQLKRETNNKRSHENINNWASTNLSNDERNIFLWQLLFKHVTTYGYRVNTFSPVGLKKESNDYL